MENLRIYNKYKAVPENAMKAFDNGNFKGTDINTMWRIKCLTDEFGICGIGWYYDILRLWTENGVNGEVMCFAEIKLFIKVDGEWSRGISATGGSKIISYVASKKYNKNSDEGYKMAITDALGVACKLLGFGADVYWENDKTKYTDGQDEQGDGQGEQGDGQDDEKEEIDEKVFAEFTELGGTLEVAATYWKTDIASLTTEHIQILIDGKKKALEKAKKNARF